MQIKFRASSMNSPNASPVYSSNASSGLHTPRGRVPPGTARGTIGSLHQSPQNQPVLTAHAKPNFSAEMLVYALSRCSMKLAIEKRDGGDDEERGQQRTSTHTATESVALRASFRGLDGGYGWVVTLGTFISFMIEGGFERGEGILYPYFLERFKQSYQLTTIPTALASTLRFIVAPAASLVCNRYSIRASVMAGAWLFACGVFLTQFATTLEELIFFYGVLTGCGRAFFSGPGLIVIGLYFRKKQGMASGIAMSGVGFGAFLLVPLIEFLLEHYTYQGAFLVLSGVALNMTVVALLYRPLSTNNRYLALDAKQKMKAYMDKQQRSEGQSNSFIEDETLTQFKKEMEKTGAVSTRVSDEALGLPFTVSYSGRLETLSHSRTSQVSGRYQKYKSVFCDNSFCQICFPVEDFNANLGEGQNKESRFQLQLLLNKAFMFYCLSTFFFVCCFKIVFSFLPTLIKSKGSSLADASFILSLSGLLDVFSRITFGLLIDTSVMRPRRMMVFICVLVAMTVSAAVLPFMGTLLRTGLAFTAFSMCGGFCLTSRTVIMVDMIGVRKLSSAFGIYMFIQGFGSLLGPPIAGLLLDVYGSVQYGYFFASACVAVSALCMLASLSAHNMAAHTTQSNAPQ